MEEAVLKKGEDLFSCLGIFWFKTQCRSAGVAQTPFLPGCSQPFWLWGSFPLSGAQHWSWAPFPSGTACDTDLSLVLNVCLRISGHRVNTDWMESFPPSPVSVLKENTQPVAKFCVGRKRRQIANVNIPRKVSNLSRRKSSLIAFIYFSEMSNVSKPIISLY